MTHRRVRWAQGNRLAGLLGRVRTALVVTTCLLIVSGCTSGTTSLRSRGPSASPTAPPVATATPGALPQFSDWRAAYLAPDGHAHIVTLDGKTDLVGPFLPDLTSNGLSVTSAGVGPDGKTLAYAAPELDLVDLTGQAPPSSVQVHSAFNGILWSPDQKKLYSYVGGGQFYYLTLATGQATTVTPGPDVTGEEGWIDNTHIAAVSYQGASYGTDGEGDKIPTSAKLVSINITSDQTRAIATIDGGKPTVFQFVTSPDGAQALYYDSQFRDLTFTPKVGVINLATGLVTPLPTIAQATGAGFSMISWRPGTNTIAVSTGYTENGDLRTWLLDVKADTATSIGSLGHPMGWAPNNGPLVVSSGWQSETGLGPYTLTAVTCANGAPCSTATLTRNAMTFAFLGFVHNP